MAYIREGHKHSCAYLLHNFFYSALSSHLLTNYMDHIFLEKVIFLKILKKFNAPYRAQRFIITVMHDP